MFLRVHGDDASPTPRAAIETVAKSR